MSILKGFRRLIVSFDVLDGFSYESLSFEHHCIPEAKLFRALIFRP